MLRSCCRSDSRQSNRVRHSRRCYLPCRSGRAAGGSPRKAMTELTRRAHEELFDRGGFHPIYTEDPWPVLPKSIRSAWTDASRPQEECHLGKPKAESSIRIASVRAVDVISVTPVRVRSGCTLW